MLTWNWEAVIELAIVGDDAALALLSVESREAALRARTMCDDGQSTDDEIAALISTVRDRRPVRLH